jgi:hypothetical protein
MKQKLVLLFIFFYLKNFGCDICGSFMGLTPYDNQSQICLLHRYRVFNGYRNYQQVSKFVVPGAYRGILHNDSLLQNDTNFYNHSSKDYESYKVIELRAKYFLSSRLEINTILPVQQIKTKYNDVKNENTGIVDPSLFIGYHLIKRIGEYSIRQRLIIGAGLKFPLGQNDKQINNYRLSLLNQNGTGSWDSFYYVNYIISKSKYGINSNTLFKLNGTNKYSERIGNSFNQILSVFIKLNVKNISLFPSILANYEFTKGILKYNQLQPNTNMNTLLLGPSIDLSYKNFVFNSSFQFNVYERVSSQNLSSAGRLVVAATYNFKKKD